MHVNVQCGEKLTKIFCIFFFAHSFHCNAHYIRAWGSEPCNMAKAKNGKEPILFSNSNEFFFCLFFLSEAHTYFHIRAIRLSALTYTNDILCYPIRRFFYRFDSCRDFGFFFFSPHFSHAARNRSILFFA